MKNFFQITQQPKDWFIFLTSKSMETKTPNILIIEDEAKNNLFCVISFIFSFWKNLQDIIWVEIV